MPVRMSDKNTNLKYQSKLSTSPSFLRLIISAFPQTSRVRGTCKGFPSASLERRCIDKIVLEYGKSILFERSFCFFNFHVQVPQEPISLILIQKLSW